MSILHYFPVLQLYSEWLLCYDVCNLHWGSQLLAIWWNHLPSTSMYPKYIRKWISENTYLNTFQTVLFGALNQHFCILIMSMGLDRYFSLAYPHKYGRIFSAKVSSFFSRQHIMVFAKPQWASFYTKMEKNSYVVRNSTKELFSK